MLPLLHLGCGSAGTGLTVTKKTKKNAHLVTEGERVFLVSRLQGRGQGADVLFGSPAIPLFREGPVALRPQIALGLPLSEIDFIYRIVFTALTNLRLFWTEAKKRRPFDGLKA